MKLKKGLRVLTMSMLLFVSILCLTSCDAYEQWLLDNVYIEVKEANLNVDLNNKPELTTIFPASGLTDVEFANGWITKYFEKESGYKVKYEQFTSDETSAVTDIYMNQKPYHMMKLQSATYFPLLEEKDENFTDLTDVLEIYGKDLLETIPEAAWDSVRDENGRIYAIPETGFSGMIGTALVWNMEHLASIGYTEVPDTLGEVDDAFNKLQEKYGKGNVTYNAFATPSPLAYISPLASAFDCPEKFYENEKGEIQHVMFSKEYENYTRWMTGLVDKQILSAMFASYDNQKIINNFALGNVSCGYLPYYEINTLAERFATQQGLSVDDARTKLDWTLFVKGDGTAGSPVQEKAKYIAYDSIGYYCVVPNHMADYAAYAVDWMNTKIKDTVYEGFRLGEEGVHYEWTTDGDPEGIKITLPSSGETKYVKLLPKYNKDILGISMYQTGGNPEVGTNLWVLSEVSYNAWSVLVPFEPTPDYPYEVLKNRMEMPPYIPGWSDVYSTSFTSVITNEQKMYTAGIENYEFQLNLMRGVWNDKFWHKKVKSTGTTIEENVQAWYQAKKAKDAASAELA